MIHTIVDKDMIIKTSSPAAKDGSGGNSHKPKLQDRLVKFLKNFKDILSYDPFEVQASMSGELSHEELLRASAHVQNVHKFNVLGCGYMQLEEKYSKGEALGHGGFAKVSCQTCWESEGDGGSSGLHNTVYVMGHSSASGHHHVV